jgi:hypothetical protein
MELTGTSAVESEFTETETKGLYTRKNRVDEWKLL